MPSIAPSIVRSKSGSISRAIRALRVAAGAAMPSAAVACAMLSLLPACGGSSPHLAGANDAELVYAILPDPSTGAVLDPALTAEGVKARLSSALVPSDVEPTGDDRVRVVVDADVAGAVDDLLAWRGGLRVCRVDESFVLAPPDTAGLRPMSAQAPGGGAEERWWQGPGEAVARAVRDTHLDAGHAAFAERLPSGEFRTRVVVVPPVVTLGLARTPIATIEPIERGKALVLGLPPESRAPLAAARAADPAARVALVRGSTLLETMPLADALEAPVVLHFGEDVLSYTRASRARMLLRSPVLPPLRRVSAGPLPPRWGLAAACALLPFALSFGWLFFVRRFDRARPEPMWLIVATFALGGLAILPAALVEAACGWATPWLEPSVVTMGGQLWALPLAIAVASLVVGGAEEGSKLLGAWALARHRREFDEPVDGIVYGCASALGFAAVENVKYFAFGRMSGAVIAMRAFETVPAHMFFGSLWGYAMGQTLVSRRARVWPMLVLAAVAHGTFDALLSTDGLQLAATGLVLVLAVTFIVMLRRALRHGAVRPRAPRTAFDAAPPTEPMPQSELLRRYFRVGSRGAFLASAAAMIACAVLLTTLGTAYELLHHRVNVIVVGGAAVLLALFGLAARAVAATIPLDVAVDAQGITFAGSLTAWGEIASFVVEKVGGSQFVRLETKEGTVRLGPADGRTAGEIAGAIGAMRG